jgi:predicted metal-dependent peptidase
MSKHFSDELTEAMSVLLTRFPFFAVLLMTLLRVEETDNANGHPVPTAATDQKTIFVNPQFLQRLTLDERVFLLAHEILHTAFSHITRADGYRSLGYGPDLKPFNNKKWNFAGDYNINSSLIAMGLKAMPQGGLLNPQFDHNMIVDEIYEKLEDPPEDDNEGGGGHGGFDEHLPPSPDAPTKGEVAVAVAQAAQAAKGQGTLPGGLGRIVSEILSPKKNWQEILRDCLKVTTGRDEVSWHRVNRRKTAVNAIMPVEMPFFPGTTGHSMGGVAIVIDTSGSVSDHEIARFLGELSGILTECRPEWIKLLWVDSEVAGVDEPETASDLETLKAKGGGGTHMPAAFDWLEAEQLVPDACVILTDGYTDFGSHQVYPVIWGITTEGIEAPHGQSIHIEV